LEKSLAIPLEMLLGVLLGIAGNAPRNENIAGTCRSMQGNSDADIKT